MTRVGICVYFSVISKYVVALRGQNSSIHTRKKPSTQARTTAMMGFLKHAVFIFHPQY